MNLGEPRCISVDDVVYDLIWKPIDCPVSDSVKKVIGGFSKYSNS